VASGVAPGGGLPACWRHAPSGRCRPGGLEPPFEEIGIDQRLNEMVPGDLVFRDETGREVRLADYLGDRPVVLVLAYYRCPMLCTLVLNGLASSLRALGLQIGSDYEVITVSIDPTETPDLAAAKKQTYVEEVGDAAANDGWHFLTGDQEPIRRLADAVGFRYVYDAETEQYAHAAGIMIVTPAGRLARYFYGIDFPPRDVRLALVEASEGRVGSVVDRLLLLCYQYDPATGRYGPLTVRLVQAGGVLILIVLGTFIILMLWRESRSRKREAL
jgi:protein SCO1/2